MTRHTAGDVEQLQRDFAEAWQAEGDRRIAMTREQISIAILTTTVERLLQITQDLAERIEALEATKEETP